MSASHIAPRIALRHTLLVAAAALFSLTALVQDSAAQKSAAGSVPFPAVQLATRVRGAAIPEALGSRLSEVAAFYGMSASELEAHARSDRDMFADVDGRLGYACEGLAVGAASAKQRVVETAAYPLDQTFLLHSVGIANRTIYLDFNGHVTSGTKWNSSYAGGSSINTPPYDTDGNPASFSDVERAAIQEIWQRVSEDFAPFEIDVTTEDPGVERLRKSANSDLIYGVRVCIGGSSSDWFGAGAGGASYVGSFDWNSDTPCYVFSAGLDNGYPKYVAEASSHEAGHTLGLTHDGTSSGVEYYEGQGDWAPIMGVGYYRSIVQWSKGEYANANNHQDDLAVMLNNGAVVKYSDHGDTFTTSTVMTPGPSFGSTGTIERTTDVDGFEFESGSGAVRLYVNVASPSPNLDALARLFDGAGHLIATADPTTMGLTLNATVPRGTYHLMVEGVGSGDPVTNGYSDYASLGNYTVLGNVPNPINVAAPEVVAQADPTSGSAPLTVNFSSAGSFDPDGSIVSFDWDFADGSPHASDPNPTHTFTIGGNFACRLTATDDGGLAAFDTVWVSVQGPPPAPSNLAASPACDPSDPSRGAIALSWRDNSSNEDRFEVEQSADGVTFTPIDAQPPVTGSSFTHAGLALATPMFYRVRAVNTFGASSYSNVASATTHALPDAAPTLAAAAVSASQINLSWNNVANETGYELQRSPDGVSGWAQIAQLGADVTTFGDAGRLSLTTYFYRIRALGPCSFATAFSAVAQAMTSGTITAPGSLAASAPTWTQVRLAWVDKSNNEQGFKIQRSSVKTFAPSVEFSAGANAATFTDGTVAPKTLYYYRVRGFAGTTFSAWTTPKSITTPADSTQLPPLVPSNPSVTALAGPSNLFRWQDNAAYENGFEIHRSTASKFTTFSQILVGRNVTSYQDSVGLVKGTKYYYRVRSFNAAGSSSWTSAVSVTASSATAPLAAAASEVPVSRGIEAGDAPAAVRLSNAGPNPFSDRSTLAFDLPAAAAIDLSVFDISGRRIAVLASGVWRAGRHQAQWDGRDQGGRRQAPGMFFVRLSVGRLVMARKLILAR